MREAERAADILIVGAHHILRASHERRVRVTVKPLQIQISGGSGPGLLDVVREARLMLLRVLLPRLWYPIMWYTVEERAISRGSHKYHCNSKSSLFYYANGRPN